MNYEVKSIRRNLRSHDRLGLDEKLATSLMISFSSSIIKVTVPSEFVIPT